MAYRPSNTTLKTDFSKLSKEEYDTGMIIQAPAPEWSLGVGYWYHDGSEVRWHEGRGDNVKSNWADNLRGTKMTPNEWHGPNFPSTLGEGVVEEESGDSFDPDQNIVIEKKLFGARSLGNVLDRGFEEFHKDKKIDLNKFF